MISIKRKEDCCGCTACLQICPKKCIAFKEDEAGFYYPSVDTTICVKCGLCVKVCPMLRIEEANYPNKVYALKCQNELIRSESSSGGVFTLLAERVLEEGGVVFGARFDEDWTVIHDYVETKEDLRYFRGAKYMQSKLDGAYIRAALFLKEGRKVMFTGTPCQIAGLKKYLKREYDNLLTVDFICHGVPSSKVWKLYLSNELKKQPKECSIDSISFRAKDSGWHNYSVKLTTVDSKGAKFASCNIFFKNDYMRLFLSDLILRPSCYNCLSKSGRSGADVTLGDFWGIEKKYSEFDDDRGVSVVLVNRDKGICDIIKHGDVAVKPIPLKDAIECNKSYFSSPRKPIAPFIYKVLAVSGFDLFMKFIFPIYHLVNKIVTRFHKSEGTIEAIN